ncbi:MAG TPA: dihydropteroate synthase [Bacteroidales bacterium]|nr:dihydropteroate synthase [Bacteroidales bacterium]HPT03922.1 dihydropteroate synthase [Bacteroidales bacterium]
MNLTDKDTSFSGISFLDCNGRIINLEKPVVMGILNITPDSFFDGGKYLTTNAIIQRAGKILDEGGSIIDLGAVSTRPGAKQISENEELNRLLPALNAILKAYPDAIVSVDTYRAGIAQKVVDSGASIINDISGGSMDTQMFSTIAKLKVPYILMHMKGTPQDMQINPEYSDVVNEIKKILWDKVNELHDLDFKNIIIDPGFGFGKSVEHNYEILNRLAEFKEFGYPVLAGMSRKSMINKVLKINPAEALNGTTVVNTMAICNGADILRVHDVKEAVETIKITEMLKR